MCDLLEKVEVRHYIRSSEVKYEKSMRFVFFVGILFVAFGANAGAVVMKSVVHDITDRSNTRIIFIVRLVICKCMFFCQNTVGRDR